MNISSLSPQAVKPKLTADGEIAFIDVREHGQYGEGHPFFAVNMPYSRLELLAADLLQRLDVPIVLFDDDDGVAPKAAQRLYGLGYRDIAIMTGGAPAWVAAGYTLFKGVHVPSKAFGEAVEHACDTPRITAQELKARLDRNDRFVLLDGRTPSEFRRMNIPSGRACPNGELAYRIKEFVPDDTTPVVINCAGRTRSIIGAQTLMNFAVPNPIVALENGTQGWELAGYELQRGAEPGTLPEASAQSQQDAHALSGSIRERFDIPTIDIETLRTWQTDRERSLYLLDVRTRDEYEAGHFAGSRHAPGGQLVQGTDQWVAIRGARIVLLDDCAIRATSAAMWLRQMSHEAFVLDHDVTELDELQTSPEAGYSGAQSLTLCPAADLANKLRDGALLLDLRPSFSYREMHIDGAQWAIRPVLQDLNITPNRHVILITGDAPIAELAAIDLFEQGVSNLSLCREGPDAWQAAGLTVTAAPDVPPDEKCIDHLFFVHDRHGGSLEAARKYLAWETNLLNQMDDQESSVFRIVN